MYQAPVASTYYGRGHLFSRCQRSWSFLSTDGYSGRPDFPTDGWTCRPSVLLTHKPSSWKTLRENRATYFNLRNDPKIFAATFFLPYYSFYSPFSSFVVEGVVLCITSFLFYPQYHHQHHHHLNIMKVVLSVLVAVCCASSSSSRNVLAFAPTTSTTTRIMTTTTTTTRYTPPLGSTMAETGGVPTTTAEPSASVADAEIPTNLPSECGMDYIPLATMLATGQLVEADQFTRDALITISGARDKKREFVYFTDVPNIPATDLATIERLWLRFSNGKFGYSVQKKKWKQSKGDFEVFCRKIGWTTQDGDVERKKRWFGASEFIYDVQKAPEGHLPLTSALRGTSLIKNLLQHPVWETEDWREEP